jgi:hypothetical protein
MDYCEDSFKLLNRLHLVENCHYGQKIRFNKNQTFKHSDQWFHSRNQNYRHVKDTFLIKQNIRVFFFSIFYFCYFQTYNCKNKMLTEISRFWVFKPSHLVGFLKWVYDSAFREDLINTARDYRTKFTEIYKNNDWSVNIILCIYLQHTNSHV